MKRRGRLQKVRNAYTFFKVRSPKNYFSNSRVSIQHAACQYCIPYLKWLFYTNIMLHIVNVYFVIK